MGELFAHPLGELPDRRHAVENLVGYVRRNALVPLPRFASWEELNAHLLAWCDRERTRWAEKWEKERQGLRPLPATPFRCARTRLAPVSRLSLVTVDRSRYSVPCTYVGRALRLAIFTERIEAWQGEEMVACHVRSHLRGETVLELAHYLPALARKPRAAMHAAVVTQLPPIYAAVRARVCGARKDGYRDFVAMLLLHQEFPAAVVTQALEEALERGCLQPAAVRQLALNHTCTPPPGPVAVPPALARMQLSAPDLARYNQLLAGVRA